MDDPFGLSGKVAVVIGGTGELCGAMAEGLAAAGAEVVLVGRNAEKAAPRLERIAAGGGRGCFASCEATSKSGLESLLAEVLARSGRVDVLVNGAGINSARPFLEIPEEEIDRILAVNTKAVFLACQVFGAWLVERASGDATVIEFAVGPCDERGARSVELSCWNRGDEALFRVERTARLDASRVPVEQILFVGDGRCVLELALDAEGRATAALRLHTRE